MNLLHRCTLMAALALSILPGTVPAGEAPASSAATQRDAEKKLAEAQQKLDAAAREVAELSSQMGRRFNLRIENIAAPPRALLGVNVDTNSGRDGARVMDVSPNGAAAEAGIRQGDIITGIADLDLTKDGNPARALIEKMNQLEPDQKVKVAVQRDGRKLSFDVSPRPAPPGTAPRRELSVRPLPAPGELFREQRGPGESGPQGEPRTGVRQFNLQGAPGRPGPDDRDGRVGPQGIQPGKPMLGQLLEIRRADEGDARFGGAELASLSERLGGYFGVKSGVLVVRAGVDSQFKLQDGDVILAVDGREISSAQQAGRILRSYQPGEKLTLKVQRDRKVQNLEITAPGGRRAN